MIFRFCVLAIFLFMTSCEKKINEDEADSPKIGGSKVDVVYTQKKGREEVIVENEISSRVKKWWNSFDREIEDSIEIQDEPIPVRLKFGADAYFLKAYFANRGVNFRNGLILYIPATEVYCDMSEKILTPIEIRDIDHDGVSEIYSRPSIMNQGYMVNRQVIYQISQCFEIPLRQVESEDNGGAVGADSQDYKSKVYEWEFKDIDGDGREDLIETETITEAGNSTIEKTYLYFKNGMFTKDKDG